MSASSTSGLQEVWERAGRPGVDKLLFAARRAALFVTDKDVRDFVRAQSVAQVFQPAPRSTGKVTSARDTHRWQADLLDYKTKTAEKNRGFKVALVVTDVFSRKAFTEPVKSKSPADVAAAFERVLERAGGAPVEVSTDGGAEFKGAFSEMLERRGIAQLYKEQRNSLAVNDAAMRTLKAMTAREMTASGNDSWVEALPKATRAYNDNSHPHLMGSAPNDVKDSPELQYALEKEAGEDIAHNHAEHMKRLRRLLEQGAFRVVLPRSEWTRTGEPRYSERVREVDYLVGSSVVGTDGARFAIRDVLAVPSGSADVQVPQEIRGGNPVRQSAQQAALRPFAEALKGFLGDGFLTLQGAGTKLSHVPGFRETMRAQRIGGIGALQRFLALFPEFVIEGQAPRARVRLTETARQAGGAQSSARRRVTGKTNIWNSRPRWAHLMLSNDARGSRQGLQAAPSSA